MQQFHVLKTRATKVVLDVPIASTGVDSLICIKSRYLLYKSLEKQYIYCKQNLDFEIYFENELW